MGEYRIGMTDLLTKPQNQMRLEVEMKSPRKEIQTDVLFSIDNHSHFSSIYSDSFANENDGKIQTNLGKDDVTELSITIDRVLRIFGHIALFIQAFWRNVYLFKYPRMGYAFFSCLLFTLLLLDTNYVLTILLVNTTLGIIYNHPKVSIYMNEILNQYVFILHQDFKCPRILGKS